MYKKEIIAMILAGGQGSRLGVLTANVAKPAVSFGGKYRIIDFPLSNCVNSGIDTVGVITQYQPMRLHAHIGIGIPWDLDVNNGGVSLLPPYEKNEDTTWYTGTANSVFQNIHFIDMYQPEYVLILAGDHVYKMDYDKMLAFHKKSKADVTLAARPVAHEEAKRFGIVCVDEKEMVTDFQEKPENPKGNLASMGIYIFSWPLLKATLLELHDQPNCDFGKHVIPYLLKKEKKIAAFSYKHYWKDVGTLFSYWEANMGMVALIPEFSLYDEKRKIYTNTDRTELVYIADEGYVERTIVGEATDVYGTVIGSVIGTNVKIGKGSVIRDSIIMSDTIIGDHVTIDKTIIAENCRIGNGCVLGCGEERPNEKYPDIYYGGLVTIGEDSVVPANVRIGKNTAISGITELSEYPDHCLPSGKVIIKEGENTCRQ